VFEVPFETFRVMHARRVLSEHGYWLMRREQTTDPLTGEQKTEVFLYLYRTDAKGNLVFTKLRLLDIPKMYYPDVYETEDVEEMANAIQQAFERFAKEYMQGLWEAKRYVGIG